MKRILGSCTILLLGLVATQTIASAQATPGLEGVWSGEITPVNCQTGMPIDALPFHVLHMFGHDGSFTNESANLVATPASRRSSGVGHWQHTQAQTYTAAFQFFVYNPDESFMLLRRVSLTITLAGDSFTSVNQVQDFDWYNQLVSMGCTISTAKRIQ
jgi:hypothetical protein